MNLVARPGGTPGVSPTRVNRPLLHPGNELANPKPYWSGFRHEVGGFVAVEDVVAGDDAFQLAQVGAVDHRD